MELSVVDRAELTQLVRSLARPPRKGEKHLHSRAALDLLSGSGDRLAARGRASWLNFKPQAGGSRTELRATTLPTLRLAVNSVWLLARARPPA